MNLVGLNGVNGKRWAYRAHTVAACLRGIAMPGAVSFRAGDEGSITAWIDDSGVYRVEHQRYRMTISAAILPSRKAVGAWWKEHLPLIEKNGRVGPGERGGE
jgi:hypothetical protein